MSTLLTFAQPQTATGPDALEHITNHGELAVQRLPAQFANSPNVIKLTRLMGNRFQGPEDALWQARLARRLAVAVGQQLDQLGSVVGQPREGKTDATYRVFITIRVALDRSKGTGDDVLLPFLLAFPSGTVIQLIPEPIAAFRLYVGGALPTGFASTDGEQILELAKAAGVRCVFEWDGAPLSEMLVLDWSTDVVPGATQLDWSTNPVSDAGLLGGALASCMEE